MLYIPHVDMYDGDIFSPTTVANIPFLLIRQIVRDISELTNRRGCGVRSINNDLLTRLHHK